jgi:hypothetical protein
MGDTWVPPGWDAEPEPEEFCDDECSGEPCGGTYTPGSEQCDWCEFGDRCAEDFDE